MKDSTLLKGGLIVLILYAIWESITMSGCLEDKKTSECAFLYCDNECKSGDKYCKEHRKELDEYMKKKAAEEESIKESSKESETRKSTSDYKKKSTTTTTTTDKTTRHLAVINILEVVVKSIITIQKIPMMQDMKIYMTTMIMIGIAMIVMMITDQVLMMRWMNLIIK